MRLPPIWLTIDVPAKNQRQIQDSEIPAERYFATWDGITLLATWENEPTQHVTTPSGGHVVGQVLIEAASRIGRTIVIQACTPLCEYEFNHTTVIADVIEDLSEGIQFQGVCPPRQLHLQLRALGEDRDTLLAHTRALHGDLAAAFLDFAVMKNTASHAVALSFGASDAADVLLDLMRRRAAASLGGIRSRATARWHLRGWRRHARRLIADLWLLIARIQADRRHWSQARDSFEAEVSALGASALFDSDYRGEASDLERLDLGALQAAIQHAAARLDNRDLVAATGVGALAGALAGALTGLMT